MMTAIIVKAFKKACGVHFFNPLAEFSQDDALKIIEKAFQFMERNDFENYINIFAQLTNNKNAYVEQIVDGELIKVFDFDRIDPMDIVRVCQSIAAAAMLNAVRDALENFLSTRDMFDQSLDTVNSDGKTLNDRLNSEDISAVIGGTLPKKQLHAAEDVMANYYKEMASKLDGSLDDMAETAYLSFEAKMPKDSFFKRVKREVICEINKEILSNLLKNIGQQLEVLSIYDGSKCISNMKMKNMLRMYFVGENGGEVFNLAVSIYKATLEVYLCEAMMEELPNHNGSSFEERLYQVLQTSHTNAMHILFDK